MKKIAVNVVEELNLQEVHNDIVNFLYPDITDYHKDLELNNIQIDYFICHPNVTEVFNGTMFENSNITSSILTHEDTMFNNMNNGTNSDTLQRVKSLFKVMYRSHINALAIHKNSTKNLYNMIISYDNSLKDFKVKNNKNFTVEQDFLFINIIEPRWLNVNYKFYVCATSTFFRIVNFWHFLSIVSDSTFKIWTWMESRPDADRFIFPMWLNNQFIKVREINDL